MGPPLRKGRKPYTRAHTVRPYKKRETLRRAACAEAETPLPLAGILPMWHIFIQILEIRHNYAQMLLL